MTLSKRAQQAKALTSARQRAMKTHPPRAARPEDRSPNDRYHARGLGDVRHVGQSWRAILPMTASHLDDLLTHHADALQGLTLSATRLNDAWTQLDVETPSVVTRAELLALLGRLGQYPTVDVRRFMPLDDGGIP